MKRVCPNCGKEYDTVLSPQTDNLIQIEFPDALPWEREQCISGICSDKCWSEFLGPLEEEAATEGVMIGTDIKDNIQDNIVIDSIDMIDIDPKEMDNIDSFEDLTRNLEQTKDDIEMDDKKHWDDIEDSDRSNI